MSSRDDPAADDGAPPQPDDGPVPAGSDGSPGGGATGADAPEPVAEAPSRSTPAGRADPGRRRVTAIVVAVGVVLALLVVGRPLVSGAFDDREQLLSTNSSVVQSASARLLESGRRTCEDRVYLPSGARVLRVYPGYAGRRAPRLTFTVEVRGRIVARVPVARYPTETPLSVRLGKVPATDDARVCIGNAGPVQVGIADARGQFANESRPPIRVDVLSGRSPDVVSMVPDALERAGRFKAGIVGPALLVVLGLLVLVGVGAVVVAVLRDGAEDPA